MRTAPHDCHCLPDCLLVTAASCSYLTFTEAAQRRRLTRPGLARTRHPALDWLTSGLCHLKSVDIGHPGTIYPVHEFLCAFPRWEQGPDLTAPKWCLVFVIYIELAKCATETRTRIVSELPMQVEIRKVISARRSLHDNPEFPMSSYAYLHSDLCIIVHGRMTTNMIKIPSSELSPSERV